MANLLRIAGRTAFGLLFVLGGMKLQDPEGTIAYTAGAFASSGVTGALASFGLDITPFIPIMFYIATALEVLGGLALIFGAEKLGAALLFAFLVSVTYIMHKPEDQQSKVAFLKNVSLAGACLYILGQHSRKKGKAD